MELIEMESDWNYFISPGKYNKKDVIEQFQIGIHSKRLIISIKFDILVFLIRKSYNTVQL